MVFLEEIRFFANLIFVIVKHRSVYNDIDLIL